MLARLRAIAHGRPKPNETRRPQTNPTRAGFATVAPIGVTSGLDGEWIPLRSSNLEAVKYDDASSALVVRFRSGSTYRYDRVPRTIFTGLLQAWSAGRYHRQWIRSRYPYVQLS